MVEKKSFFYKMDLSLICGRNSIGRVPAFQAGCCEFEPRRPLIFLLLKTKTLFFKYYSAEF